MRDTDELAADLAPREYPRASVLPLAVLCGLSGALVGATLAYPIGATSARHATPPIACTPNIDSVRVVPTVWPRGPVAGARP